MKTEDPYMERVQKAQDPIIRKAQERILRAARAVFDAKSQLYYASKEIERHPDFIKTERARRKGKALGASLTPAWWVHYGIKAALEDASLEDAADWLLEDSNPRRLIASLRCFVETEKKDLAARRRPASRKAASLVAVPEAA